MTDRTHERLIDLAQRYPNYEDRAKNQVTVRRAAEAVTRNSAKLVDSSGIALATATKAEAMEDAAVLADPTNEETLRLKFSQKWRKILDTPNAEKVLDANGNPKYVAGFADKHLEVSIRDHLNNGGSIGGFELPKGFRAVIPENPNFEAIDIRILNPLGEEMPGIQVKLTKTVHYLKSTLRDLDERGLGEILAANADAPQVDGVDYAPFTRDGMYDEGADYLDAATETPAEELAEEAAIDVGGVSLVQAARVSVGMARNLLAGLAPTEGLDWHQEGFTLVVNAVATGVGNVAQLAGDSVVPGVGTATALGTKTGLHRVKNYYASATALDVATARVRGLSASAS